MFFSLDRKERKGQGLEFSFDPSLLHDLNGTSRFAALHFCAPFYRSLRRVGTPITNSKANWNLSTSLIALRSFCVRDCSDILF